jgi:hypothetical protein
MSTQTLVEQLIPTVDNLRELHKVLGTRPYRVWRVKTKWSGGIRGEGEEVVIEETEITPPPRIEGIESLEEALFPTGRAETGSVELSEVSLSYSESDVAWGFGYNTIPPDEDWFYEVRWDNGQRRRFYPISAPQFDIASFGWRIRLGRQYPDRTSEGVPYR